MKKIRFTEHILPHLIALVVFVVVTVLFFSPVFFESKAPVQPDIQEYQGSAKAITDFREQTGEEPLWTNAMFGGMPAYLISVQWSNQPVLYLKKIISVGLPHPISNILTAFVCYYIMLLCFRVRPYLAIAGAIAFGLSSYVIIGFSAGHNGRIGAIATMPLIVGGIHLAFTRFRLLGGALVAAGMALHLRENHLQITYYLLLIVLVYGIIRLVEAIRTTSLVDFGKTIGVLLVAVVIGLGTYFGQFWAVTEYSKYSTRGKSDLAGQTPAQSSDASLGISKEYAFEFSNSILEPLTLMIPDVYGGSSSNFLVQDPKSETYQALVSSGNQQTANQLARYTSAYWGEQRLSAPYYAGAIIVFLFAVGIAFADKKYRWWLVAVSIFGVMLTWGSNFAAFNYFLFDYLPGYNKFRSVTFAILLPLFAMPLLGMLGLESLWERTTDKETKRKLLYAFGATGGLCLLLWIIPGVFDFISSKEAELPAWFTNALAEDRKDLLRSDAFRSLAFIFSIFILLYLNVHKKISPIGFYAFLILMVTVDLVVVDKRYLTKENFKRKRDNSFFAMTESDQVILADKNYYRVYNLGDNPFTEARTSYYHNSVGGYHGAKLRRYSEFYDSCVMDQTQQFISRANSGNISFEGLNALNMLNVKYIVFGPGRENVIPNSEAFGNAWFVENVMKVNSAAEEIAATCNASRTTAVVDVSQFNVGDIGYDSAAYVRLLDHNPKMLSYESQSSTNGLVVFSDIYYPEGWIATIDGKEQKILRANYILRALEVPAGKHTIEFRFEPDAYVVGNKVTMAFSWIVVLSLIGGIVLTVRSTEKE